MMDMTGPYPVFLNLKGRRCLVVGGGRVALRKVQSLLWAGASVTVIAPDVDVAFDELEAESALCCRRRRFRKRDVDGQMLVFAATGDREVNAAVTEAARRNGAWVNVADAPADCDFQVPAVSQQAGLCIAVSSGGASPALSAWLRDKIAEELPGSADLLLEMVRGLRELALEEKTMDPNRFRTLFDAGIWDDLASGNWGAVETKVIQHFGPQEKVRNVLDGLRREGR